MPVRKFRSGEEMTPFAEARPHDPANLRAAIELSRTCIGLSQLQLRPVVRKFRSIEEANEARRAGDDLVASGR